MNIPCISEEFNEIFEEIKKKISVEEVKFFNKILNLLLNQKTEKYFFNLITKIQKIEKENLEMTELLQNPRNTLQITSPAYSTSTVGETPYIANTIKVVENI